MSITSRIPEDLLIELDRVFPNQCPNINDSEREIWKKVGQRSVVEFLKKQYEIQNRNILNDESDYPDEE